MSGPAGSVDILKLDLYKILGVQEDATEKEVCTLKYIRKIRFDFYYYIVATSHNKLYIIFWEYFIWYSQPDSHKLYLLRVRSTDCRICILPVFFKTFFFFA